VERGVKFGAHIASTGRSELKVAQYAMASNGFKGEVPRELRETDLDDIAAGKSKKPRGDGRGLRKLQSIEENVRNITSGLSGVSMNLGGEKSYAEKRKDLEILWTDRSESYLTKRSVEKKDSIVKWFNMAGDRHPNLEREKGWDKPARILGMVAFGSLRMANHTQSLITEIQHRDPITVVEDDWNFTQLKKHLQDMVIAEIKQKEPSIKEADLKERAKFFKPESTARFESVDLEN